MEDKYKDVRDCFRLITSRQLAQLNSVIYPLYIQFSDKTNEFGDTHVSIEQSIFVEN